MRRNSWLHITLSASLVSGLALPTPTSAASGLRFSPVINDLPLSPPAALAPNLAPGGASPLAALVPETLEEMMAEADLVAKNSSTASVSGNRGGATTTLKHDAAMSKAMSLAGSGQYQDASKLLFQMSRSPRYESHAAQVKYILGLMLFEMRFYQAAAFVFYDVVRTESRGNLKSKYLRQSLEKIALAADILNSEVLLRYAIKQIKDEDFPAASRDMLAYRMGEIKMQEKDYAAATREFVKVRQNSQFYYKARYRLGLALAEAGQPEKALIAFEDLAEQTKYLGVTDSTRVSALLGRARTLYQKRQYDAALEAYRDIPRDTEQWHESLFESSWAMLMDGRFRSALSNFHSLHSPYYEDFYQPESLYLRAIVYLYICKHDEMDKVIGLFEKTYRPVLHDVKAILTDINDPITYYKEIQRIAEKFDSLKGARNSRRGLQIPFLVARHILKEGDVRRTFGYLRNLESENHRLQSMPAGWRGSAVGLYVKKILDKRIQATQGFAGRQVRHHMALIQNELVDLFEQAGFLRFEMLSSKKEVLRKEIAGKELTKARVDENQNRNYYVQNGFEYWPFTGEYWLDEIGNYHYVGVKSCE